MGLWHAIDRAATKPNDNGNLATVCSGNWRENKQKWTSLQFVSSASVLKTLCNIYVEIEFIVFSINSGERGESGEKGEG